MSYDASRDPDCTIPRRDRLKCGRVYEYYDVNTGDIELAECKAMRWVVLRSDLTHEWDEEQPLCREHLRDHIMAERADSEGIATCSRCGEFHSSLPPLFRLDHAGSGFRLTCRWCQADDHREDKMFYNMYGQDGRIRKITRRKSTGRTKPKMLLVCVRNFIKYAPALWRSCIPISSSTLLEVEAARIILEINIAIGPPPPIYEMLTKDRVEIPVEVATTAEMDTARQSVIREFRQAYDDRRKQQVLLNRLFVIGRHFDFRCPVCGKRAESSTRWSLNWWDDLASCTACARHGYGVPFLRRLLPFGIASDDIWYNRLAPVDEIRLAHRSAIRLAKRTAWESRPEADRIATRYKAELRRIERMGRSE